MPLPPPMPRSRKTKNPETHFAAKTIIRNPKTAHPQNQVLGGAVRGETERRERVGVCDFPTGHRVTRPAGVLYPKNRLGGCFFSKYFSPRLPLCCKTSVTPSRQTLRQWLGRSDLVVPSSNYSNAHACLLVAPAHAHVQRKKYFRKRLDSPRRNVIKCSWLGQKRNTTERKTKQ